MNKAQAIKKIQELQSKGQKMTAKDRQRIRQITKGLKDNIYPKLAIALLCLLPMSSMAYEEVPIVPEADKTCPLRFEPKQTISDDLSNRYSNWLSYTIEHEVEVGEGIIYRLNVTFENQKNEFSDLSVSYPFGDKFKCKI